MCILNKGTAHLCDPNTAHCIILHWGPTTIGLLCKVADPGGVHPAPDPTSMKKPILIRPSRKKNRILFRPSKTTESGSYLVLA